MGSGKSVSPAIIGIVVVVLIAFVAFIGYRTFGPDSKPTTATSQAGDDFISQMAKKSGGDMSKLSPEEAEKLNKMTGGHGAQAMSGMLAK